MKRIKREIKRRIRWFRFYRKNYTWQEFRRADDAGISF